jgi:aminoglycoside phosphotransferase (APT) family kinase protein
MERRTTFLELSPEQIQSAATHCGVSDRVVTTSPLLGGRVNTLYRMGCEGGRELVLRLYARDPETCSKEVALSRRLGPNLPVAPLAGFHAQPLPGIGVPAAIFEFVGGQTLDHALVAEQSPVLLRLARAIGRILASMAAVSFPPGGDLVSSDGDDLAVRAWNFGGDKSFVRYCVEDTAAGERLGAELVGQLLEYERRGEERWRDNGPEDRLVHGDFNPSNIIVRDNDVAAVLDWEFALAGDPLMDFGNILRSREGQSLPEGFGEAIAGGFRAEGGTLPVDWRERAAYIDLSSACEALTSVENRPRVHAAALRQIRETLDHGNP